MRDVKIMDIAMNLARIGNWAADDYDRKKQRIDMFLRQTDGYLRDLDIAAYPPLTQRALTQCTQVFRTLRRRTPQDIDERLRWAEDMLTWSNILTHRAKLAQQ